MVLQYPNPLPSLPHSGNLTDSSTAGHITWIYQNQIANLLLSKVPDALKLNIPNSGAIRREGLYNINHFLLLRYHAVRPTIHESLTIYFISAAESLKEETLRRRIGG
jgi:hypothetical protein